MSEEDKNNLNGESEAAAKPQSELKTWKERRAAKKEAKRIKEEQKSFKQNVLETLVYVAVMVCIALFIKTFIGQPVVVSGTSMNDTLDNWNFVWANKLGYKPKRFDVVVVKSPKTNNDMYIKRLIALPGETVYIDTQDRIFITPADGGERYQLEDPYGWFSGPAKSRRIMNTQKTSSNVFVVEGDDGFSYKCGDDEYFIMGDNRYNSQDSRVLGGFTRKEIKEHAVFRIWPLNKLGDFDKSNEK